MKLWKPKAVEPVRVRAAEIPAPRPVPAPYEERMYDLVVVVRDYGSMKQAHVAAIPRPRYVGSRGIEQLTGGKVAGPGDQADGTLVEAILAQVTRATPEEAR